MLQYTYCSIDLFIYLLLLCTIICHISLTLPWLCPSYPQQQPRPCVIIVIRTLLWLYSQHLDRNCIFIPRNSFEYFGWWFMFADWLLTRRWQMVVRWGTLVTQSHTNYPSVSAGTRDHGAGSSTSLVTCITASHSCHQHYHTLMCRSSLIYLFH